MRRLALPLCLLAASCGQEPETETAPPARGPHEPGPGHTVNYPKKTFREIAIVPWKMDKLPERAAPPLYEAPESFDAIRKMEGSRCPEGARNRLLAYDRDRLALDLDGKAAAERFGPVEGLEKPFRHPHFALAALLEGRGDARSIEIWPSDGDPLVLAAKDVTGAPARYVLLLTPRRGFKLVDGGTAATLRRNLAAVRIVR